MSHDQSHDVEAYALGALDPAEARTFEEHAASCDDCAAELLSYQPLMRGLRSLPIPAPAALSRRRARRSQGLLAAAAALAIFVGGGAIGRQLQQGTDRDMVSIATMAAGSRTIVMGAAGTAQLRVFVGAQEQRTAFVIVGAPPAPPGHTYQVWLRGGPVRSPGLMRRTANGLELLVVPGNVLTNVRRVGVSIEPAGGSPKRTTPPVIGATVAS